MCISCGCREEEAGIKQVLREAYIVRNNLDRLYESGDRLREEAMETATARRVCPSCSALCWLHGWLHVARSCCVCTLHAEFVR